MRPLPPLKEDFKQRGWLSPRRIFLLLLLVVFFHFLSYMSFFPFSLVVVVLLKFRKIPSVASILLASKPFDFGHVVAPTNLLLSLQKDTEVYSEGDIYLLDRAWDVVNLLSSWRLDGLPSLDLDVVQVAFFKWTCLMTWLAVPFILQDVGPSLICSSCRCLYTRRFFLLCSLPWGMIDGRPCPWCDWDFLAWRFNLADVLEIPFPWCVTLAPIPRWRIWGNGV